MDYTRAGKSNGWITTKIKLEESININANINNSGRKKKSYSAHKDEEDYVVNGMAGVISGIAHDIKYIVACNGQLVNSGMSNRII